VCPLQVFDAFFVLLGLRWGGRLGFRVAVLQLVQRLLVAVTRDEQLVHADRLVVLADLLVGERAVHRGFRRFVTVRSSVERDLVGGGGLTPLLVALRPFWHGLSFFVQLARVQIG